MTNVIDASAVFGDEMEVRRSMAANRTYDRAIDLGYSKTTAHQLARVARKEASDWEDPMHTALRVATPPTAPATGGGGSRGSG